MIPVLEPEEMAQVDRAAPDPVEVLVGRAGMAAALAARQMLGGTYGKKIVTVAGPGNNGADGRAAGALLRRWGASVTALDATEMAGGAPLPRADLVIDAAYGTGLKRPYEPPDAGESSVLAIDIPSGLSGRTGTGTAMRAARTVTFAAYKPGLLQGDGPELCGEVEVAGIGLTELAIERARCWLVTDADVIRSWNPRARQAHKWQSAVAVVGGSPSMGGAPWFVARGALRAGAGYALVGTPGLDAPDLPTGEQVGLPLPATGWGKDALEPLERTRSIVVGPGLGQAADAGELSELLAGSSTPAVVDADALRALGTLERISEVAARRRAPLVLTPHEGEFASIAGHRIADDRISEVREAAARAGSVVLLKGSPTMIGDPGGEVRIVNTGSSRLASAGTGDVLSGVIAAFLARGLPALDAASLAAHVHGRAAASGRAEGLVASDLPDLISGWLSDAVG